MKTLEEVSFKLDIEKADGTELAEIKENRAYVKFQDSDVSCCQKGIREQATIDLGAE